MSKKILTPAEKVKRYGNSIAGVGIFYLFCAVILIFIQMPALLNPINLIIYGVQIAMLLAMVIGAIKRRKYGVTAAWIFEGYMVLILILTFLGIAKLDLIGLIVMIFLPADIRSFSKALKELNSTNQEYTTTNV